MIVPPVGSECEVVEVERRGEAKRDVIDEVKIISNDGKRVTVESIKCKPGHRRVMGIFYGAVKSFLSPLSFDPFTDTECYSQRGPKFILRQLR